MEQNATTNQMENTIDLTPEQVKITGKVRKPKGKGKGKNPENVTFPIMNAKRENIDFIHPDDLKNPLMMIGKLCNTRECKMLFFVDFPKNKVVSIIPAAGTYGPKERALIAHRNFLNAITNGMERDAAITNKETLQTLALYKSIGWKFTTFTKLGILTVAAAKIGEVSSSVNLIKAITVKCKDLEKVLAGNDLRKEITKEINDKGLEAGIKLARSKSLALPPIQK